MANLKRSRSGGWIVRFPHVNPFTGERKTR